MSSPTLPYRMPDDTAGKVQYLSSLMSLKLGSLAGIPEAKTCDLLTDVVLYHHLGRLEKFEIMKKVNALPGRPQQALTEKILLPLVSPYWGIWAMPTGELLRQHEYFDAVSTVGSHLGLSFSGAAGWDLVRQLRRTGTMATRGLAITAAIWGFFWMNNQTRDLIREEIFRRARDVA